MAAMQPGPAFGKLSSEEAEALDRAIPFLRRFVPTSARFFNECQENPAQGSVIARSKTRDLALTLDVSLLFDSACDHLTTVVNVVDGGLLPRYSPYTVVRGALEADAWLCWVLDTALTDLDRLARALTLRANSLYEARRIGAAPARLTPQRHYTKRMKRVFSVAKRWKLTPKTDNYGRVSFVTLPKVTPLLRALMPDPSPKNKVLTVGEQTYAELSARAHGTYWAALQGAVPVKRLDRFRVLGVTQLDVVEFVRLLGIVVSLHDEAMKRMATLAGRNAWEQVRGTVTW
jgi:hypothetical protein